MSADRIDSPPPELRAWLDAERPLPEVPGTVQARIYARLRATLGYGGPGGTGGAAGGATFSGASLGAVLAVLLGAGTVAFVGLRTLLYGGSDTANVSPSLPVSANPHEAAASGGSASSTFGVTTRPPGHPRLQADAPGGATGDLDRGSPRHNATAAESEARPRLPPWIGQRNVEPRRIAGVVLDRGRPAPGVAVILEGVASAADPRFTERVRTTADGRFVFGPQPAWSYVVWAAADGRRPAGIRVRIGDPAARPAPDALVLELGDCTAGIWGVVSDQSGQGVPEVRVRRAINLFGGPSVETDDSGRYQLCSEPGPLRLRVEGQGYGVVLAETTATAERSRLDIRLANEAVAQGTTVTLEGVPLPDVQLNLVASGGGPRSTRTPAAPITTISDDQGRFEARGLAPGRYWVNAWSADHLGREPAWFEVQAGEVKRGIVRRLHPTSQVDALVVSNGRPLPGAKIQLAIRETDDDSSFGGVTQSDGRVTLHGVFLGNNEFRLPRYRVQSPESLIVGAARVGNVVVHVVPKEAKDTQGPSAP